jgi:hypothetical protein
VRSTEAPLASWLSLAVVLDKLLSFVVVLIVLCLLALLIAGPLPIVDSSFR